MKFGKASDLTGIDFRLPEADERSLAVLGQLPPLPQLPTLLGSTAWGCKEWVGKIYPRGTKPTYFLDAYQRSFDTIELNTTHYRTPTAETVMRWREQVAENKGFQFCPKWPQSISHYSGLNPDDPRIREFLTALSHFGPTLGWSWIQLPEHFGPEKLRAIEAFCSVLPRGIRLAWEFRHPDWFADGQLIAPIRDLLEALGMAAIITDVAGRRDVCHASLTAPVAIVRWVGNALHPTDAARIEAWAERLAQWQQQGLQQAILFIHQPDEILAPEATDLFVKALKKKGIDTRKVRFVQEEVQGTLF